MYVVDRHVHCVIFNLSEMPSPEDLVALWSELAVLGDLKTGALLLLKDRLHLKGAKSTTPGVEVKRTTPGSVAVRDLMLSEEPGNIEAVLADSIRRGAENAASDYDFTLSVERNGRNHGIEVAPMIKLSLSEQVVVDVGAESCFGLFKRYFEIVDKYQPSYGFIEVARSRDNESGSVHTNLLPLGATLAQRFENRSWFASMMTAKDRARGLYWGNYFGPGILERIGGAQPFQELFTRQTTCKDGSPSGRSWRLDNGLLFTLSNGLLDSSPGCSDEPPIAAIFNVDWLVPELGPKGVFNYWSEG